MTELRFGLVAADNLADALSRTAREFRDRYDGAFHLVVQGHPRPLHPLVGDEICRISREAISTRSDTRAPAASTSSSRSRTTTCA